MLWRKNPKYLNNTIFKYLIVGAINTFTGLLIIYLAKWLLVLGDVISNIIGYSIGITLSFILNKKWSFRYNGAVIPSLFRFIIVALIAYISNLYTVIILIEVCNVNSYTAQALGIIPYIFLGYLGSKFFAFKHKLAP